MTSDLLTPRQAAEYLGVSVDWLRRRRNAEGGPPFVQLGPQLVRYRVAALERWLDACSSDADARGTGGHGAHTRTTTDSSTEDEPTVEAQVNALIDEQRERHGRSEPTSKPKKDRQAG